MKSIFLALLAMPALLMFMAGCSQQDSDDPVVEEAALAVTEGRSAEAIIAEALSAAPASMADRVSVADWAGNVYREGSSAYTCLPTPPNMTPGTSPMCMDGPWMAWAQAWGSKSELSIDGLGISYMLAGDGGASNIDPYAAGPAEDNDWLVEGPHLMVITPDMALLDALPTDYNSGGPYVMWKGSLYAHIMVPVELADAHTTAGGLVEEALSAATTKMAARAKVMDWEGNVLQEGEGAHTCLPTPPIFADGFAPMCMDDQWMAWAHAWGNQKAVTTDGIGISYMLAGDAGGSNIDPYGTEPTDYNEWVVSGPHMMIIVPDSADLAGLSTDSQNGGPYVMWRDTPYAHVMIPIGD